MMAVFWVLLMERKRRAFYDVKGEGVEKLWERVRFLASLWASISAEFKEYSVSVISLDRNAVCCNGLDRSYFWVCSLGVVPFLAQS